MSAVWMPAVGWWRSLGIALLLHAAVIAGLVAWQSHRPPVPVATTGGQPLMIELAAPPMPSPSQMQTPTPVQPRPTPAQRPPSLHPPASAAQAMPPVPSLPQAPGLPMADTLTLPPAQMAAPAQAAGVPAAAAANQSIAPGEAVPNVAAADATTAGSAPLQAWQGRLLSHLRQHRRYPRQAQRWRQQGVVQLHFQVNRQGHVSAARLASSSGHPLLDAEALATLQRASPVPAPPAALATTTLEVLVPVEFFLAMN